MGVRRKQERVIQLKSHFIGTYLRLRYTTGVTSQSLKATGEVLCSRGIGADQPIPRL